MANNKRTEELAINVLENALLKSPYLESYIDKNDKTPSWDGNVIVYRSTDGKKSNIFGKVPIQVKGTEVNPVNKDGTITYSAEVADLKNYYGDGGAIFFVVFVSILMVKGDIYYASLLPFDLNGIVKDAGEQGSYSIQLSRFPDDSPEEMANIFMSFAANRPKQMGIIGKDLPSLKSLENNGAIIESISFGTTGIGINQDTIPSYIVSHDFYLYAKIKGSDIDIPVEKVSNAFVTRQIDAPVKVKDRVFYKAYAVVYEKGKSYIKIGKSLSFIINKEEEKGTFDIKIKGCLSERIRDLAFIICFAEEREITINGATININPVDESRLNEFRELLEYWNDVKKMLDVLGVKEELDCDQLLERDAKNIHNFVNTVLYNKEIGFPSMKENLQYGLFSLANLRILLWYEKQTSGNYKIQSFFQHRDIVSFESKDDKHPIEISQFLLLRELDFSHVSNFDAAAIIKDLSDRPLTTISSEMVNFLALDLIAGYDKQEKKDETLLELATTLFDILDEKAIGMDKDIICLNKLQIVKRKRKLVIDEIVKLASLKDSGKPISTRCGAYILLDDYDNAKECLDAMETKDKKEFMKFPIFSLYEKKGE